MNEWDIYILGKKGWILREACVSDLDLSDFLQALIEEDIFEVKLVLTGA